jgi:hypothetical protein
LRGGPELKRVEEREKPGYTLPSILWNQWVTARLPSKSLRNKDLRLKYSKIRSWLHATAAIYISLVVVK